MLKFLQYRRVRGQYNSLVRPRDTQTTLQKVTGRKENTGQVACCEADRRRISGARGTVCVHGAKTLASRCAGGGALCLSCRASSDSTHGKSHAWRARVMVGETNKPQERRARMRRPHRLPSPRPHMPVHTYCILPWVYVMVWSAVKRYWCCLSLHARGEESTTFEVVSGSGWCLWLWLAPDIYNFIIRLGATRGCGARDSGVWRHQAMGVSVAPRAIKLVQLSLAGSAQ